MPEALPASALQIGADGEAPWPAGRMFDWPMPFLVDDLAASWRDSPLPSDEWGRPPEQAVLVPIKQQGHDRPAGFLVVGIYPYRRYDTAYSGFVELIAGQCAAGIANARAYDEERRRAEAWPSSTAPRPLFSRM